MIEQGIDSWFLLVADYAYGHSMEQAMREAIPANGGKIVGSVRHPLNTLDFSSYLLQAQGTGAKIIALASGGDATVNAIKQGREFGLDKSGTRLASLLTFLTDVHSLGLETMQGLQFAVPFYWDMDDKSRAFSKRFEERVGKKPGEAQSGVYSGVLHYLKAVQAAGTKETKAVLAKMGEMPVEDAFSRNGKLLPNGRMIHDMFLVRVKKPSESKGPWDYYSLVSTIPADKAFRPARGERLPDHEAQLIRAVRTSARPGWNRPGKRLPARGPGRASRRSSGPTENGSLDFGRHIPSLAVVPQCQANPQGLLPPARLEVYLAMEALSPGGTRRAHADVGCDDRGPELAGCSLKAARDVDDVAHDRELAATLRAEVARHHRPAMNPDRDLDRHRAPRAPLRVPAPELPLQLECAGQRAFSRVLLGFDTAERRHEAIAQILVERATVAEHDPAGPLAKAAQQGKGRFRRQALGHPGEADNIGVEHGNGPHRGFAEDLRRAGDQRVDKVWRDVAGEVSADQLGLDLGEQHSAAAPDGSRDDCREQARGDELRVPGGHPNERWVEKGAEGRLARDRSVRRQPRKGQRLGKGVDRLHADRPDDGDGRPCPKDRHRRIGQRSLGKEQQEIQKLLPAQPTLDGPIR
jgi:hypothetical protein